MKFLSLQRVREGSRTLAAAETRLLLAIVYWLIVPLFTLLRLRDPLFLRKRTSTWRSRDDVEQTPETLRRMF